MWIFFNNRELFSVGNFFFCTTLYEALIITDFVSILFYALYCVLINLQKNYGILLISLVVDLVTVVNCPKRWQDKGRATKSKVKWAANSRKIVIAQKLWTRDWGGQKRLVKPSPARYNNLPRPVFFFGRVPSDLSL